MKYLFTLAICFCSVALFAQQKQNQYLLIIRSKAGIKPTPDVIKSNMQHWRNWMGELGMSGKITGGYRPATDGLTLNGTDKITKPGPYVAMGEEVSSILVINAADMNEAKQIAAKCPVFELQGSVEVRPIINIAN